eukprot:scaffold67478_cov59-Attheya_sp.AAC.2
MFSIRRALSLGWIMTVGSSIRTQALSALASSKATTATTTVLGKTSTALEVLKELNASNRLADYACHNGKGTAVVTGGSSGIGVDTVSTLALTGMTVILCVRNVAAGEEVRSRLPKWCQPNVRVQLCDLADLTSVQQAAHSILKQEKRIDLLVNNA